MPVPCGVPPHRSPLYFDPSLNVTKPASSGTSPPFFIAGELGFGTERFDAPAEIDGVVVVFLNVGGLMSLVLLDSSLLSALFLQGDCSRKGSNLVPSPK